RLTSQTRLAGTASGADQSRRRDRQRSRRRIAKRHSRSSHQRPRRSHGRSLSLRRNRHVSGTIIRNGRVIDPANKRDEVVDLVIVDGKIAEQSKIKSRKSEIEEVDAKGLIVAPGLIDMHTHLREPGFGHKATIASAA